MNSLIIALLLLFGSHDTGWSSHYDPHVMSWQVDYHGLELPCDDCAIAVADCSLIGDTWLIRPQGEGEWIPVVVADCAGNDGTPQWMHENNIILELSYPLAVEFGAVDGSVLLEVVR